MLGRWILLRRTVLRSVGLKRQVQRRRNNAETADKKAREFWLNLARRWEELSHARNGGNTNVRAARELPLTRTIYSANRLASSEIIPQ
jgi:hypothetical protein